MIATKEKTEEAREREIDAKSELKILKETISSKEDEAASYKRRIQFLRSKVKEATAEIDQKEKRLDELTEKAEVEADKGRELTYAEVLKPLNCDPRDLTVSCGCGYSPGRLNL